MDGFLGSFHVSFPTCPHFPSGLGNKKPELFVYHYGANPKRYEKSMTSGSEYRRKTISWMVFLGLNRGPSLPIAPIRPSRRKLHGTFHVSPVESPPGWCPSPRCRGPGDGKDPGAAEAPPGEKNGVTERAPRFLPGKLSSWGSLRNGGCGILEKLSHYRQVKL